MDDNPKENNIKTVRFEDIEKAIDENKNYRKKWLKISIILFVVELIVILVAFFIQENNAILSEILSQGATIGMFFTFLMGFMLLMQERTTIPSNFKIFYYFNKILTLFEEYKRTKDTTKEDRKKKNRLKKEIGKKLLKILKINKSLILYNRNELLQHKNISDINFFKRVVYKINASIKKNEELSNVTVTSLKTYFKDKLQLTDQYYKDNIEKNNVILGLLNKEIQEEDDEIFSKYFFLKERLFKIPEKILKTILFIASAIILYFAIFIVLPMNHTVDFNNQMVWFLLAYAAIVGIISQLFK